MAPSFCSPFKSGIYDQTFGNVGRTVALVEREIAVRIADLVTEAGVVPSNRADVRAGVGIQQQFIGIESMAVFRLVRPMNPVAIYRSRLQIRDVAVPDFVGEFRQVNAMQLALSRFVEEAHLYSCRVFGK